MLARSGGARRWLAALALAALTLTVFARLQYSGPESAVIRFHLALTARTEPEMRRRLQEVTLERVDDPRAQRVIVAIRDQLVAVALTGLRMRASDREIRGDLSRVIVQYAGPGGRRRTVYWIAVRAPDGRWKVSAWQTWLANSRVLGV